LTEPVSTPDAEALAELRRLADEQAALRRVATLVAREEPPAAVFAAVAEEVGRLLGADVSVLNRHDAAGDVTTVAGWSRRTGPLPKHETWTLHLPTVSAAVSDMRRPARVELHGPDSSAWSAAAGVRWGLGAPINVEGRLWGVVIAAYTRAELLRPGAEERLADFTDLVATAIANTQAREELRNRDRERQGAGRAGGVPGTDRRQRGRDAALRRA